MKWMMHYRVLCTGGSGFIGTHLVDSLMLNGASVLNIDVKMPLLQEHRTNWRSCNILDRAKLLAIASEYQPTHLVHLAARASLEGKSLDDFRENTEGTASVLDTVNQTKSISRLIVASSQHVRRPGSSTPHDDEDYDPYMLYGESKVIAEKLTRKASLNCIWTIIRPTTVWGPWHPYLAEGLWRVIRKGWYSHPGGKPVMRCYGYIGNVVYQILEILKSPGELVDRHVYYLGEPAINQLDWVNAFARALTGKEVRVVPRSVVRALALVGDAMMLFGIRVPIYTRRYKNMITDNAVPVERTIEAFGKPPYSLAEGVAATVRWLDGQAKV